MADDTDFAPRVELPGGEWVELRDPRRVTERERRPLKRRFVALAQAGEPGASATVATPLAPQLGGGKHSVADVAAKFSALEEFTTEMAMFFITAWSYGSEATEDSLLDLPADVYDAIDTAVSERLRVLFPQMARRGPTTP